MANGVNVKMGVSGVAQFKQSINQAKTSIKTLDAQLALTEKQYKATGDAETYMQQKTEQLQGKLDAQKQVVENAEKALQEMTKRGVDMSSKAFQDMIQTLARAKGDLLDTQAEMQGVEAASDNAAAGIADMASELQSIGTQVSFQTVTDGLTRITDGLQAAAKKAWEMGKALVTATLGAGAWADEIATEATKAGMSTQEYQQAVAAANLVDTSVDSILASQQKLAQATEKDNEAMAAIFARLGVQTKRYGEVRDLNDIFWETGEALMKIENEVDRADMGKKLFGQWRELIPLFTMGREEYEKLRDSQSYVDDEHLKALTDMDDQYQKLQHEIETVKMQFLSELAPATTKVMDSLTGMVQKFNEYMKTEKGQEMMKSLGDAVEKLFSSVTNFDPEQAVQKVGEVMGSIQSGFEWISNNWQSVETGLKGIVAAWAGLKLTGGALKILEFINGIRGLTGAGVAAEAAAAGTTAGTSWAGAFAAAAMKAAPFLAFLYTTLTPSGGTDEIGNSTLLDENGSMTREAEQYGYTQDSNGNLVLPDKPMVLDIPGVHENVIKMGESDTTEEAIERTKRRLASKLPEPEDTEEWNQAWEDAGKKAVESAETGIEEQTSQLAENTETLGENAAIGLANGIDAGADEAIAAAQKLADEVKRIIQDALQIQSPSKVMMRLGEFVSEGFAEGIENGYGRVNETMDRMSQVATTVSSGNSRGTGGGTRMIDVTLMIGPDKLTEVIVPLVDSSMGEEINLMRR